jgi:hypothetical protein
LLDAKYLYFTSALLCLLYLIGFFKNGKAYKIFTIYIIGVLLMDVISSKLYSWFRIYNIFMNHFYDLFQFVILSYFYATLLKTKKQLFTVYILLIILPVFLLSRYVFNPQMFFEYSLLETYLTTMPLIIYSSMHLYNNLGEKSEFYFINVGLLFYLFTSTFIFLLYKLITVFKFDEFNDIMIDINIILQYIKFGFFFYQWKLIYFNKDERN